MDTAGLRTVPTPDLIPDLGGEPMSVAKGELDVYIRPGGKVPSRTNWPAIASCWRGFVFPNKHVNQMYEVYLAMSAKAYGRAYYQVRAHPNGRRLFQDRPDVLAFLGDDDYLASLPAGSLGHAYRAFLKLNRLDAGVYDEATQIRPLAEKNNWSEDFYYLTRRATALHDLFHVIGGYGPDMAGEVIVFGFHCGQIEPSGLLGKWGHVMALAVPGAPVWHKLRVYRQAVDRGRRADKLLAAPWEDLLGRQLDEVRAELGVMPTERAHPKGLWFTSWCPISDTAPQRWDYDAILSESSTSARCS